MGNSIENRGANQARWEERVKQANRYPEGVAAYCRANGVSLGALNYWRKKGKRNYPAVAQHPAFIPIQVMGNENGATHPRLPDPKWLAELILHMSAGVSRRGL